MERDHIDYAGSRLRVMRFTKFNECATMVVPTNEHIVRTKGVLLRTCCCCMVIYLRA